MTPKALADLRALAEAATPGPWTAFESAAVWELYADRDEVKHGHKLIKAPKSDPNVECYWPRPADAAYIAALSPDVVLALLERAERAELLEAALNDAWHRMEVMFRDTGDQERVAQELYFGMEDIAQAIDSLAAPTHPEEEE